MQVYEAADRYQDAFLEIQRLKVAAPDMPGLMELQQRIAAICLDGRPQGVCCRLEQYVIHCFAQSKLKNV